jgi:hypothetical protein
MKIKPLKGILIMLGWMLAWPASSQHIVWEKVFGSTNFSNDEINSILPLESGGFLTVGVSSKLGGVINQNGTHDGVILLRIDENGDTLYIRKLNIYGYPTPYLIEKYPGIYQTVIDARIPMGTGTLNCPAIVEFNEQGVIFQTHILSQYPDWLVSNAIKTKDYGVILSGTFAGGLTAQTQMMSIKVNFLGEVEWSQKWNPPASVRGDGRRLFQTDSNEFMVTGTLGRRIGGFTFDSLGNQLATKVFYETPSMRQFDGGEASPTVTKGDLATGYYRNGQNQVVGSFSKRNNLGLKEWGGEQKEAIFDYICTNTDETFWVFYSNRVNDNVYLKKFGPDSSSLKEIYLFQAGLNGCEYRQYLPLGNNQVIAVGYRTTSNFGNQFLITKIDSFGIPITSIQKPINFTPAHVQAPVLYPNPAHEILRFKNLQGKAKVSIYNLRGQLIKTQSVFEEEGLSVRELPRGQYLYHVSNSDKKVFTGLFLKE